MTIKIDLKPLAIAVLSGAVAIGLVNGSIQEVIHFQDPLAELAMCALAASLSIISLITSIKK